MEKWKIMLNHELMSNEQVVRYNICDEHEVVGIKPGEVYIQVIHRPDFWKDTEILPVVDNLAKVASENRWEWEPEGEIIYEYQCVVQLSKLQLLN